MHKKTREQKRYEGLSPLERLSAQEAVDKLPDLLSVVHVTYSVICTNVTDYTNKTSTTSEFNFLTSPGKCKPNFEQDLSLNLFMQLLAPMFYLHSSAAAFHANLPEGLRDGFDCCTAGNLFYYPDLPGDEHDVCRGLHLKIVYEFLVGEEKFGLLVTFLPSSAGLINIIFAPLSIVERGTLVQNSSGVETKIFSTVRDALKYVKETYATMRLC